MVLNTPIFVSMTVDTDAKSIPITIRDGYKNIRLTVNTTIIAGEPGDYDGPYVVTPSDAVQVLPTKNAKLDDYIRVQPIPKNYGLITWNGSFLTVS